MLQIFDIKVVYEREMDIIWHPDRETGSRDMRSWKQKIRGTRNDDSICEILKTATEKNRKPDSNLAIQNSLEEICTYVFGKLDFVVIIILLRNLIV